MATKSDITTGHEFFSDGPAPDRAYMVCRDSEWRRDIKQMIEALWRRYEPYCPDRHFLTDARSHFAQRTWEAYLASVLLNAGITLVKPAPEGPDLHLQLARRTWIEAIAVKSGTGPDAVRGREERGYTTSTRPGSSSWHGQPPSAEEVILRCTHAILEKYNARQRHIDERIVRADDAFVIAINIGAIEDADVAGDSTLPIILNAVFGIGREYLVVTPYSAEEPTSGRHHRPHIAKKSGAIVGCDGFTSDKYLGLSGVMFSTRHIVNVPAHHGTEMHFVHNPRATMKLPVGTFPFGREWFAGEDGCLHYCRHFQPGGVGGD
jgi:hypothetical protein